MQQSIKTTVTDELARLKKTVGIERLEQVGFLLFISMRGTTWYEPDDALYLSIDQITFRYHSSPPDLYSGIRLSWSAIPHQSPFLSFIYIMEVTLYRHEHSRNLVHQLIVQYLRTNVRNDKPDNISDSSLMSVIFSVNQGCKSSKPTRCSEAFIPDALP